MSSTFYPSATESRTLETFTFKSLFPNKSYQLNERKFYHLQDHFTTLPPRQTTGEGPDRGAAPRGAGQRFPRREIFRTRGSNALSALGRGLRSGVPGEARCAETVSIPSPQTSLEKPRFQP